MAKKRKILNLILCGKVLGVTQANFKDWLEDMPELNIIADIKTSFIYGGNSSDITVQDWVSLGKHIESNKTKFDGFIVLHNIDNILYTSSALSFSLSNLDKPVIFTGIQEDSKAFVNIGVKANLINSVQVAIFGLPEVCLMFGNRLLKANQSDFIADVDSLNLFNAPKSGVLGKIDFSVRVFEKLIYKRVKKVEIKNYFNNKIKIFKIVPNFTFGNIDVSGVDGLVFDASNLVTLPREFLVWVRSLEDLPVVIWSNRETVDQDESGNLIFINNMTWFSTVAKFMWLLSFSYPLVKLKNNFYTNISGEIIEK